MFCLANETEMLITWVTIKPLPPGDRALVLFGLDEDKLENAVEGGAYPFQSHFITYRALLTGLKPETKYCKYSSEFFSEKQLINC